MSTSSLVVLSSLYNIDTHTHTQKHQPNTPVNDNIHCALYIQYENIHCQSLCVLSILV